MRHGPPARDGEALPEVACLSCVTSNDGDTPAEVTEIKIIIKSMIWHLLADSALRIGR